MVLKMNLKNVEALFFVSFFFVYKLDSAVGFGFRDIREKCFGTISLDSVYRVPPRQYTR